MFWFKWRIYFFLITTDIFYRFLDMKTLSILYSPWLFINKDCTSEWIREGENLTWQMLLCRIEPGENEHKVYSIERAALAHANENASVIAKESLTEIIFCTQNYKVYTSSWWTAVCLRSRYPCYVMLPRGWSLSWYRSPRRSSLHQPEFSPWNPSLFHQL